MKVLKMYNWEQKIVDRVTKAREEEIRVTRSAANWFNFIVFLNWGTRNYMIVAIVAAMSVSGEALTPGNIFAGITVLAILNMSIRFLPDIINNFIQLLISMNRIEEYLRAPEAQEYNDREMGKAREGVAVELKEASFSWSTGCQYYYPARGVCSSGRASRSWKVFPAAGTYRQYELYQALT
jgi:ABC-type multidrug transport system fused ATPase/permease subunit